MRLICDSTNRLVDAPGDLAAAFERAFAANGPYLVDVHCDPDATTPVTPWNEAKQEWEEFMDD